MAKVAKETLKKAIEIVEGGLICDNPKCTYTNPAVKTADYVNWVDQPCPKCGENLLTEEDFAFNKMLLGIVDFVNTTELPVEPKGASESTVSVHYHAGKLTVKTEKPKKEKKKKSAKKA